MHIFRLYIVACFFRDYVQVLGYCYCLLMQVCPNLLFYC
uniref:Predicted protein n=1 Tax=Hordeum vulgare subsp. vulgare TaxID=112509 RepID=F2D4B5_HORVV|nr:predicted protein [Hordeum vulgare subsp. vulgare]